MVAEIHIEGISPFTLLAPLYLLGVAPSVSLLLFSFPLNSFFLSHYILWPPSISMLVHGVKKPWKIDPTPRVKAAYKAQGLFFQLHSWGRECGDRKRGMRKETKIGALAWKRGRLLHKKCCIHVSLAAKCFLWEFGLWTRSASACLLLHWNDMATHFEAC